jgi:peroxiredoxin
MQRRDIDDSIRRHPSSLAPPERHRRFGPWGIFATVLSSLALVAGVVLAFLTFGGGSGGQPGGTVGAQAPEFDLTTIDGREEVQLSTLRGRVVVVSFERSSCGACFRSEMALDEAWRRFRQLGVTVMGIRRDTPAVAANVGSTPGPWPVLSDPNGDTAQAYGVRDSMETFVIDGDGKVVAALDGPVTVTALSAQLSVVLGVPDPGGLAPTTVATVSPAATTAPTTGAVETPSVGGTTTAPAATTGAQEPPTTAPEGTSATT